MKLYIIPLIVLLMAISVFAVNFPYGGVILVNSTDCSQQTFASTDNNDILRGNALLDALAATSHDFDTLYLSTGTFDIQNNSLDLSRGGDFAINMHGAGAGKSIIRSAGNPDSPVGEITATIMASDGIQVTDLSVINYGDNTNYQAIWGNPFPLSAPAYLAHVTGSSGTDIFHGHDGFLTVLIDVNIITGWDATFFEDGDSFIQLYDSNLFSSGNSFFLGGANSVYGIQAAHADFNIWNSHITVTQTPDVGFGVFAADGYYVNLYNSSIETYDGINSMGGAGFIGADTSTTYDHDTNLSIVNTIDTVPENIPELPAEVCPAPTITTNPIQITNIDSNNFVNLIGSLIGIIIGLFIILAGILALANYGIEIPSVIIFILFAAIFILILLSALMLF